VQKTKFANKALQSGPYKIVDIDIKAKRAQLERPADGQKLEKWTSVNRLQKVSAEAVATKTTASGRARKTHHCCLTTRRRWSRRIYRVSKRRRRRQTTRNVRASVAMQRRSRRERRSESDELLNNATSRRRAHEKEIAERRATAQIPDDAVPEKRVYTTQGEIIIVSTANGKIGISRQRKQFNKLAAKLNSFEAERKEINKQAQKKKQAADRFIRQLRRQARK
jgi:hypothetical protein